MNSRAHARLFFFGRGVRFPSLRFSVRMSLRKSGRLPCCDVMAQRVEYER